MNRRWRSRSQIYLQKSVFACHKGIQWGINHNKIIRVPDDKLSHKKGGGSCKTKDYCYIRFRDLLN